MMQFLIAQKLCVFLSLSIIISSGEVASDDVDHELTSFNHQLVLPWIGFGTAGLGSNTRSATIAALDIGCRLIDSAQAQEWYDEVAVGAALRELHQHHIFERNPPIIVTKVHPRSFEQSKMRYKLEESQRNFHPFGIDVVLLHSPFCWPGSCSKEEESINWLEGWKNLESSQDQFGIRAIGVSNFGLNLMEQLVLSRANRKVAVVQNWMDPFHQDRAVRAFARQHGIQYMAYSSFGTQWQGSRRLGGRNPVLGSSALQAIAAKHACSVARVVLAWLSAEGVVALPRSGSPAHLQENFELLDAQQLAAAVPLDEQDLLDIRGLDGTLGDPWDG